MVAVYARQSVDRTDSISIDSQIEACRYEIKGEDIEIYADRGYSGKDTNRPMFSRMIEDIKSGRISKVVVYKLDRVSRSILDFTEMMKLFENHQVDFVSSTEKFDTSSPMGRAMLSICAVFAQLERETIKKRVADAYYSRSLRGFYMGGPTPYGFRKVPLCLQGVSTSKYEPEPEEAVQIKLLFELYSLPETSFGDVLKRFSDLGFKKRGRPWVRARISEIIKNPIYVKSDSRIYEYYIEKGAEVINGPEDFIGENGCYYYRGGESAADPAACLNGYVVLAPHDGIVSSDLWLACRDKCLPAGGAWPRQKAKNTWLAGLIKCGVCGYALVDKRVGDKNRYLVCTRRMDSKDCRGPGTLYTDVVESIVYDEILYKLAGFTAVSGARKVNSGLGLTGLNIERLKAQAEISSLAKKLAEEDEVLFSYIKERIKELHAKKSRLEKQISELKTRDTENIPPCQLMERWERLGFEDRRKAASLLISAVRAEAGKLVIEWKI